MDGNKKSISDREILRYIEGLDNTDYDSYHTEYEILNLRHYLTVQLEWMRTAKYFAGQRLRHDPSPMEILEEWEIEHNPSRFRVFYILRYSDMVLKLNEKS